MKIEEFDLTREISKETGRSEDSIPNSFKLTLGFILSESPIDDTADVMIGAAIALAWLSDKAPGELMGDVAEGLKEADGYWKEFARDEMSELVEAMKTKFDGDEDKPVINDNIEI